MKTYAEKLRDPRWQRKRLEIMQRDDFKCRRCGDTKNEIQIHHLVYRKGGLQPWEYPDNTMMVLCDPCHQYAEKMRDTVCLLLGAAADADSAACWALEAYNPKNDLKHWANALSAIFHCVKFQMDGEKEVEVARFYSGKAVGAVETARAKWLENLQNKP